MIRATDATFPFICMQAVGACTEREIAAVKPVYERAFARKLPHVSISDARRSDHSAKQRKIWADWTNESMAQTHMWTSATIIILDSTLLRGALTAMNWIAPPRIDQHVVSGTNEAVAKARALAAQYGFDVPPETYGAIATWLDAQSRAAG